MEIQNFRAEIIIISLFQHKLKLVPSLATTLLHRSPSFVRQNFYFLLFGKCKRHNFQKYVSRSCWKLKAIVRRPSSFFASKRKTDDDGPFFVKTCRRKKKGNQEALSSILMKAKTEQSISRNRIFSEKEMVPNCKTFVLLVFFHYKAIVVILLKVAFFLGHLYFFRCLGFCFQTGNDERLKVAHCNHKLQFGKAACEMLRKE